MQTKPRRVHYVFSSHWDREWYQTFQQFRLRLVALFDRVLEAMAAGQFTGPFVTDGQAVVLEDYLEVRPEQRSLIRQLLRQQNIKAGPWYVMPDEFIVSGEALVRNLELGRKLVRSLDGEPSNAGFVCDVFGHTSQLPQILSGFGINFAYLWRGVNLIEKRNFRWSGADGTEIVCYRFGQRGYCDYAFKIRHPDEPGRKFDPASIIGELKAYLAEESKMSEVDPILVFDGADHLGWDPGAYSLLTKASPEFDPGYKIVHTSLDEYQAEVLSQAGRITQRVEGELRQPGFYPAAIDQQDLIPGVLSGRLWIKQVNALAQATLCHWAEPLSALSGFLSGDQKSDPGAIDLAWKWLLQNHAHDSICGCSIDAVHEDMRYRFNQCLQIADGLARKNMLQIGASIAGDLEADAIRLVIFNPLPIPFRQTAELTLEIPTDWPKLEDWFTTERRPVFCLFDPEGRQIAYQMLSVEPGRTRFFQTDRFMPAVRKVDWVSVSLPLSIPAGGYTSIIVRPEKNAQAVHYSNKSGLVVSGNSIANDTLKVEIEPNGGLTLTDLRTGRAYPHLMMFEDGADVGNGYNYRSPILDQVLNSTAGQAEIALIHSGPFLVSFRVRKKLRVPSKFDFSCMRRSAESTELEIESILSLRPGLNFVEVETTVINPAEDHRLRVFFPSSASSAATYLTDTPFDVVERPIATPVSAAIAREPDPMTRPQQSWACVSDERSGLAVVAPGLMEVMVQDIPERPIALTLFRSTGHTVLTDGEPGGQLRGALHFKYFLSPISNSPDRVFLSQLGQRSIAGLRNVQLMKTDLDKLGLSKPLPPVLEFIKVAGNVVVTSIRQVNSSLEVRLYNPNLEAESATIELLKDNPLLPVPEYTQPVDFEHQPVGERQKLVNRTLTLPIGPKKILTLQFS